MTDDAPLERLPKWEVDSHGGHAISVPFPGLLKALDDSYEGFLQHQPTASSQLPRELVRYRSPDDPVDNQEPHPIRTWLQFDAAVPAHRVLTVGEALKGLVLDAFGAQGTADEAPPILTGHGLPKGATQAHYWPLPSVGHDRSDGRIFGACVELPPETHPAIVQRVRLATAKGELRLPRGRLVGLAPATAAGPWSARPRRWTRSSTTWVSASPVMHERFRKGGATGNDVATWCENAGLPKPVGFATSRAPMLPGAVDLRPDQLRRKKGGGPSYPYEHLKVFFDEPVQGPFALGRLRSYGVGLMVPVEAPWSAANSADSTGTGEVARQQHEGSRR